MPFYPPNWYGKVDELPELHSGTPYQSDGSRTYTRSFLVEVTQFGKLMGPIGVCSHPALPRPWTFYITNTEYDQLALLNKYEAKKRDDKDWTQWIVTATYSTNTNGNQFASPSGGGPGDLPNNPSNAYNNPEFEFPEIDFNFDEQQKPATCDLDNKPYQNSAKQPYTPSPTFPRAYLVLNVTRNELVFNPLVAQAYAHAVNDRDFLGFPPGFVQCMPPKAKLTFKGAIQYWRVTYTLKFHPRNIFLPKITGYVAGVPTINKTFYELNWQPFMQDQGYMRIEDRVDAAGVPFSNFGKPVAIERNGKVITQQVLLDLNGQPAVDKYPVADPLEGMLVPRYIPYRQFPSKDFTSLATRGFA